MQKILHISGHKSLTQSLSKMPLKAEIITWNEILCEGKTTTDVGSEHFWKNRYDFFKSEYNTGKASFIDSILKEYRNLCNQKSQDEAVLWFDQDLHSQINMIAVMSWLKEYRNNIQVSWVKSEKPLASMSEKQLKTALGHRVMLTTDDVEHADYVWQLYCSESPLALEKQAKNTTTNLSALPTAIQLHLKRFPSVTNGLNIVENNILQTAISFNGNKAELITELSQHNPQLGFSIAQYETVVYRLKDLFASLKPVQLNGKGLEVVANTTNMYPLLRNENDYLGGTLKYDFLYYGASDKLLKL
ncbi:MAG: DUF1835 domain-containing protein [Capnocytophaga sp.]|nr:DUF1835 domain-containing protein [Capnocytophaga sp.]